MLANYGYEDASGHYYIRIDTDKCAQCEDKGCLPACPQGLFAAEPDDYDDEVIIVKEALRNTLRQQCAACKSAGAAKSELACLAACPNKAILHSW